ncbi:MAG: hypothetical protein ACXU98_10765, partial [Syntrophales bacterium]
ESPLNALISIKLTITKAKGEEHKDFLPLQGMKWSPTAKPVVPPLKYPPTPRLRRVIHRWRNPPKHQALST